MELKLKTIYDKGAILDLNLHVLKSKRLTLVAVGIAHLAVILEYIVCLACGWDLPSVIYTVSAVLLAIDFFYLFVYFIAPRISLKKNKVLGAVIEYCFYDSVFTLKAKNKYIDESSTLRYASIERVERGKKHLFLFIAQSTAYIVDLSGVEREDELMLRDKISSALSSKKIRWKIKS